MPSSTICSRPSASTSTPSGASSEARSREPFRRQLVRRRVGEIAGVVRPLGDACGALGRLRSRRRRRRRSRGARTSFGRPCRASATCACRTSRARARPPRRAPARRHRAASEGLTTYASVPPTRRVSRAAPATAVRTASASASLPSPATASRVPSVWTTVVSRELGARLAARDQLARRARPRRPAARRLPRPGRRRRRRRRSPAPCASTRIAARC